MHKTGLLESFPLAQHRSRHLLSALATAYSTLGKLVSFTPVCLRSDFSCIQYLVLTQFFLPLSQRDSVGYLSDYSPWTLALGFQCRLYHAGRDLPLVLLSCFLSRNVILNTFLPLIQSISEKRGFSSTYAVFWPQDFYLVGLKVCSVMRPMLTVSLNSPLPHILGLHPSCSLCLLLTLFLSLPFLSRLFGTGSTVWIFWDPFFFFSHVLMLWSCTHSTLEAECFLLGNEPLSRLSVPFSKVFFISLLMKLQNFSTVTHFRVWLLSNNPLVYFLMIPVISLPEVSFKHHVIGSCYFLFKSCLVIPTLNLRTQSIVISSN